MTLHSGASVSEGNDHSSGSDEQPLSGDRPLKHPDHDRLGYAPFARNLAEGLVRMAPAHGFVVALYGPWGSGKSTVLNFVEWYLADDQKEGRVLIVPFNPWWFSGQHELTKRFLEQLLAVVDPKEKRRKTEIRNKIADFAALVGEAPSFFGSGGRIAAQTLRVAPNIFQLKEEIEDQLASRAGRIIVLIDDTDRLAHDEIRDLFRLIKAVGDFRNVTYVIALDQNVAREALAGTFGARAQEYLEKIVQLPYELPLPERSALRQLFFEQLDAVLARADVEVVLDEALWTEVFFDAVDPFLRTPRDVTRLINVVTAVYPAVAGEVNVVDFVAISVIQAFESTLWDVVRRNSWAFVGTTPMDSGAWDREKALLTELYDGVFEGWERPRRRRAETALGRLFPKFAAVGGNTLYTSDWELTWRRELRIASSQLFPLYFQQAPPPGHLSRAEITALLAVVCDQAAFSERLVTLADDRSADGRSRLPPYIEQLRDHADDVRPECVPPAVRAIFDVGDRLLVSEDTGPGMFTFGNDIRLLQLLYQLLRKLTEPERYVLLRQAIEEGAAVAVAAHEVAIYSQEQGELGASGRHESDWTVTTEHLQELKQLVIAKIRRAASEERLLFTPDLVHILYRWSDWGTADEARDWATEATSNDDGLLHLLTAAMGESKSQTLGERHVRRAYRLDPKALEPFIDVDTAADRLRALDVSSRSDHEAAAVEQFLREYDARARGEDPTSLDW